EDVLDAIASRVEHAATPSEQVRDGSGPVDLLHSIVGNGMSVLEERAVRFHCRCSRERVAGAIPAMGRAGIEGGAPDKGRAEARCEFCGERWVLDEAELRSLLASS